MLEITVKDRRTGKVTRIVAEQVAIVASGERETVEVCSIGHTTKLDLCETLENVCAHLLEESDAVAVVN